MTVTDNNPHEKNRIEMWEVRDPSGQPHWIELDQGSLDDQLYLLRRLRDWASGGGGVITYIRYHGLRPPL